MYCPPTSLSTPIRATLQARGSLSLRENSLCRISSIWFPGERWWTRQSPGRRKRSILRGVQRKRAHFIPPNKKRTRGAVSRNRLFVSFARVFTLLLFCHPATRRAFLETPMMRKYIVFGVLSADCGEGGILEKRKVGGKTVGPHS